MVMTERTYRPTFLAALWMAGWLACMVTIAVAAREAGKLVHVFEIMEIRSLVGIVLFLPLVVAAGGFRAIRTRHFRRHFSRNAVHYVAQFLWFLAITMIPIAEVVAIEFTGPVWVALLAAVFLGEKMTAARVAAVVLGIVGVVIIVRPGLDHVDVGQVIALLAAIGFAGAIIIVKSLTRTESVVSIIFWMLIIPVGDWRDPRCDGVADAAGGSLAVARRHRGVRHLLAFLHGACAASRGCDDRRAARFPSCAIDRAGGVAGLLRALRHFHRRRRRGHSLRQSAEP